MIGNAGGTIGTYTGVDRTCGGACVFAYWMQIRRILRIYRHMTCRTVNGLWVTAYGISSNIIFVLFPFHTAYLTNLYICICLSRPTWIYLCLCSFVSYHDVSRIIANQRQQHRRPRETYRPRPLRSLQRSSKGKRKSRGRKSRTTSCPPSRRRRPSSSLRTTSASSSRGSRCPSLPWAVFASTGPIITQCHRRRRQMPRPRPPLQMVVHMAMERTRMHAS